MNSAVTWFLDQNIAIVKMLERESKNTFSRALVQGLLEVFEKINLNEDIKVVIIHGYENYFCCGGTQEELLNLQAGKITFADLGFYRLLLDCPIPTIAAMQGHAIGGGLAFGCFADFMILAEECIYSANFMKYGFTPGLGATYIVPYKFGSTIGHELLFTANTYHGLMLRNRGIPIPVVKKSQVLVEALELAKSIADKPKQSLKILKSHLTQNIRNNLPKIINQELIMHRETFLLPEVKERIEKLFGV